MADFMDGLALVVQICCGVAVLFVCVLICAICIRIIWDILSK